MKQISVKCAVCGIIYEIDKDVSNLEGASYVCSYECLEAPFDELSDNNESDIDITKDII